MSATAENLTAVPPAAFRQAIVLDDVCHECGGPLGDSFRVVARRQLCEFCFCGTVRQEAVINTDSYKELPE